MSAREGGQSDGGGHKRVGFKIILFFRGACGLSISFSSLAIRIRFLLLLYLLLAQRIREVYTLRDHNEPARGKDHP